MKTLFLLALAAIVVACSQEHRPVITGKSNETIMNEPMPKGLCRFTYNTGSRTGSTGFCDSCYKYNLGDTIYPNVKMQKLEKVVYTIPKNQIDCLGVTAIKMPEKWDGNIKEVTAHVHYFDTNKHCIDTLWRFTFRKVGLEYYLYLDYIPNQNTINADIHFNQTTKTP